MRRALCHPMKVLLGQKLGMSQMFTPEGEVVPVTLIWARPNIVTLRRIADRDGYVAVQLALPKKEKVASSTNQVAGEEQSEEKHNPRAEDARYLARREFKTEIGGEVQQLTVEQFTLGDVVQVTGISKGKGFQGVIKRHKMKGGPASHGHTDWERKAGSIGSRFGQHTMKGKRMAGRMGAEQVTVKNLTVMQIDIEKHLLALKGAVPGVRGSVIEIRSMNNE